MELTARNFIYPSLQTGHILVWSSEITSKKIFRNVTILKLNCLQSPVIVPFRSLLWWILWRSTGTRSLRTWLQTTAPASPPTRISCVILGTDPRPHKDPHYFPILFEFKITLQSYDDHFVMTLSLWIRNGFNADPDPAFYLNADPDSGSQTNAKPCGSGSLSDF